MTTLRDHLQAIRDEHGQLTPELVVEVASHPDHPLHSRFEWDDRVAGHQHRLSQAGALLRVTYAPVPGKPRDLRAFVAIKGPQARRSDYVPTEEALADPLQRTLLLRQLDREWKAFKRRYADMAEFADFILDDLAADVAAKESA